MSKIFNFQFSVFKRLFVYLFIGLFVYSFISVFPANAAAGINKQINFQGKLVDNTGVNVSDGTYTVVFSLYNVSSGGSATWTETDSVTTSNGIFQVALGAVTSLPGSVDFNTDTWYLGIKVSTDAEMTPRVRLTAVPYAFNADKVAGLTVTNNGGNTLNIAANKAFTVNNSITLSGTDGTTMTLPSTSTTLAGLSIANAFTNGQTISPTQASTVGLTVNTTTNATPADGLDVVTAHTSGTATNGILINQNAAGTTTNGLQIEQTSGTLTNGITFSGTIGTEINLGVIASSSTGISGTLASTTAANATGISWTTGSITTSGTQNGEAISITAIGAGNTNGISITPPATTTSGGTITALNIGGITTSGGTDTGISIGANWDKGIAVSTGTNGQGMVVTAGAVPTADMVNITNAGQGVTTAGVNALSINYVGGAAAVESGALRIDLTPGGTSGGTWNGLRMVANTTGPASGVTETALKVEAPTTGGVGTFNGLNILGLLPGAGGTVNGINLTTSAFTQTTAVTGTIDGLTLGTAGAISQTTAAGTINWNGLAITTPNITQSSGTVNSTGLNITVGTITTGGAQSAIKITPSNSNAAGTEIGLDMTTALTAGAATEYAMRVGKGWDAALALGSLTANDNTTQGVIRFATSGSSTSTCAAGTAQGLVFQDQAGNQIGHFCKDGNAGMKIAANSTLLNGTDVAENYSDVANTLTPGDLVSLDPTGPVKSVKKTTGTYEGLLFGIVSTAPGVLLSDINESNGYTDLINPKPIALTGRVPTHVSTENGTIAVGDYITSSSTPGVGMKATKAGMVVGQALQAYDSNGVGTIYVFTRAGYYNGINQDGLTGLTGSGDLSAVQFIGSPQENNQNSVISNETTPESIASDSGNTSFAGITNLDELQVNGLATISADLRVEKNALVEGILNVIDTLMANNVIVNGLSDFFGQVVFHSDVAFQKAPRFTSDTAGYIVIKKGTSSAVVTFGAVYPATPVVNATLIASTASITPTPSTSSGSPTPSVDPLHALQATIFGNGYSYAVTNVDKTGFTILLNKDAVDDVMFSWSALLVSPSSAENQIQSVAGASTQGAGAGVIPVATNSAQ